jgi:hypothetical protein
VPTELRLYGIGDLADFELEGDFLERLDHLAFAEEAEIAAFRAGILRFLLGESDEIFALVEPRDDVFGFLLGLHQDVPGPDLVLRLQLRDLFLVKLLRLRVGDAFAYDLVVIGVAQGPTPVIFQPLFEALVAIKLVLQSRRRHQLVLDDELQQHHPALLRRKGRELGSNLRQGKGEIGFLDLDAIDLCHDVVLGGGCGGDKGAHRRDKHWSPNPHGYHPSWRRTDHPSAPRADWPLSYSVS